MKKSKTAVKSQPLGKKKDTRGIKYFLWILPFLILVFLFSYFPLHGWIYSFYDYRPPRSLADCEFVGLNPPLPPPIKIFSIFRSFFPSFWGYPAVKEGFIIFGNDV